MHWLSTRLCFKRVIEQKDVKPKNQQMKCAIDFSNNIKTTTYFPFMKIFTWLERFSAKPDFLNYKVHTDPNKPTKEKQSWPWTVSNSNKAYPCLHSMRSLALKSNARMHWKRHVGRKASVAQSAATRITTCSGEGNIRSSNASAADCRHPWSQVPCSKALTWR